MPNIQDQLSQSGIKLFTYNNTPGRVFAYAPSNNAIGMGGPSQIHEITDPNSLTSLGIDPNQIQKGENLSKQLGLTYYVNGPKGEAAHFYGVGGGANFNSQGLQGLLNQYAQNTASTNYQKQQEAQTLANQPHPFMGSPSDFVTPDQQLAADRQAKLERIGLQLKDVKNQVNKFGQGKPSVSTSPVGGLYSQEFSQNAPAKSVDTATASSYVAGAGTSSIVDEYQKAIDKNIQSQKDLNAQVSKGGLASLFGGQPQQIDYAQANKNALEALGLPADFTKVQVQKLQTNIDEMNDLNKKMVDLDKQEQQAKLNVEGQQIPMYNINKQTDELTRKFAVQKSSIAADITVKKAYGEALRGNFDMVGGLIEKAVSYATHQQDQKITDYRWMYDNYKDQMKDLTTKEQGLLEHQLTIMEQEHKLNQEDLKWKAEQYIKAGVQPPSMADLGKMNITDVARAVAGVGGTKINDKFFAIIDKGKNDLQQGETWGNVWNRIKQQFPNKSNAEIDNALGGGIKNGVPYGWARPGAFKEFKQQGGGTAWQYDQAIWQWLATDGANLSDEEKVQHIKGQAGRNPESFGLYGY